MKKVAALPTPEKERAFRDLVVEVRACRRCMRMGDSERVLGESCGSLAAPIMFIGEAPGRLGADSSLIPFHGDQAGHNFETLLEQVGLNRYDIFVTNAVLCNPKDAKGNNSTPSKEEIQNCSAFLKRQIQLIQPKIVVTLGLTALKATQLIEPHYLSLSNAVRRAHKWYGRTLIPIYHPGQRAMAHRSFANQLADYHFVAETFRRLGIRKAVTGRVSSPKAVAIVDFITAALPRVTYFALHKLFFLAEVQARKTLGARMSDSYIIRQKDGPYCVDLHIAKIRKVLPSVTVQRKADGELILVRQKLDLFPDNGPASSLTETERKVISDVIERYGDRSNSELKRITYLTSEMRNVLRRERESKENLLNAPLLRP